MGITPILQQPVAKLEVGQANCVGASDTIHKKNTVEVSIPRVSAACRVCSDSVFDVILLKPQFVKGIF